MKRFWVWLFMAAFLAAGTGLASAAETTAAGTTAVKSQTHQKKTATPKKRHHKKHAGDEKPAEAPKVA